MFFSSNAYHFWLALPVFLFCGLLSGQNFNSEVEAVINTNDSKNDILEIVGTATNKTEGNFSLRYELSVITSNDGNNNSSKNSQSGRFTLEPFETKNLSHASVSVDPDNRTIILLLIYDEDDKVIGTDRKVYDATEQEKVEEKMSYEKPNEGIELTGMVTEKTKTKPGKDFYDFFYQKYNLSPAKGNKIIEIDEMISFGRTTRIMVKIDDRVIYQFFARPKLDYLKDQADQALAQVNRYFEYLKNRNESVTQY
ncbi:curli-like amyloid fiber formation chaperone CsgH [Salegentibacter sp. F188]|uniref:Curli production assembly/transport component CsgE n=1 Tax=Autumnicola patrickiae TaxID=3075591 RepID=A0ABU3E2S9_9FLAO|nr:curli-like amyloid fiber formation chaperone CsgH [Salegentibacter sp. F188]MDT0689562.1 curli-like amyloid fiber formation chaperone CsgH [Salegentibacter sp. F188]